MARWKKWGNLFNLLQTEEVLRKGEGGGRGPNRKGNYAYSMTVFMMFDQHSYTGQTLYSCPAI